MKKPDLFNKMVSEKLDISNTVVEKINSFFWKSVKKDLSTVKYRSIFLKNFGTITISKYKLYKIITEEIDHIRRITRSQYYTNTRRRLVLEHKIINLRRLLAMRNEMAKDFYKPKENELVERILKLIPAGIADADKIVEGIWNEIQLQRRWLSEDKKKEILRRRLIYNTCPFNSKNALDNPAIEYKSDRTDEHCIHCGCPIVVRTASLRKNCGIENYNVTHPDTPMELKWTRFKQ